MLKKGFLLPDGGWILSSYEAVTGTGLRSDPAPSYTEQPKACDLCEGKLGVALESLQGQETSPKRVSGT